MNEHQSFADVPLEEVRRYWNARPCNLRHSPAEVGSKEYFDQVEARKYFVEPHIPGFAQFEHWAGKRVLEVGCGLGTDTISFARAGATVTAVDLSDESLALAKRRAEVFGLSDRITFYQANAEELSRTVPVEQYDLVYSFGVLHHTPHPPRAFAEIAKYLGPESRFKLMVYHRHSWKVFWLVLTLGYGRFWRTDEWVARQSEAQTGCPVTYSYTRESVRELLPGFEIEDLFVDHIFPYSIPEYKRYEYRKALPFRWLPEGLFRNMERRWGWHLCLTARLGAQPGPA